MGFGQFIGSSAGAGGRRLRRSTAALVMSAMLAACGAGEQTDAAPTPEPTLEPTRVDAVAPALCGEGVVISARAADTAQPRTEAQMEAHVADIPADKPQDWVSQAVIVNEGLGSFRVSLPPRFAIIWRAGESSDVIREEGESRDEAWAGHWTSLIDRAAVDTRAIALDGSRSDEVLALLVTLDQAPPETGDELADRFAEGYAEAGLMVGESCGITANGAPGAFVEHTVPGDFINAPSADRVQLQFLVPDPPNDALWGVTCDVARERASDVKQLCRQIVSSFEPFPQIEG